MPTIINELSAIELIEGELRTMPEDAAWRYRDMLEECKRTAYSLQERIDAADRSECVSGEPTDNETKELLNEAVESLCKSINFLFRDVFKVEDVSG